MDGWNVERSSATLRALAMAENKKKKFLLVCEGPSDIAIFKRIADKFSAIIEEISPIPSASGSTSYPSHGWSGVQSWCQRMAANKSTGNPLDFYLKFTGADGLIIQLDTDISHLLNINGDYGGSGDRAWCEKAIDSWLSDRKGHPCTHYILCSYATEAWILATYSNSAIGLAKGSVKNYETIQQPDSYLLALGYTKKAGALKKSYQIYSGEKYATRIIRHSRKVAVRCAEFERYVSILNT